MKKQNFADRIFKRKQTKLFKKQNDNNFLQDGLVFGKRVNDADNFNWKNISTENINLKKPVIICLGGVNTSSAREANFMASTAQKLLGIDANYVDIYSAYYNTGKGAKFKTLSKKFLNVFENNISNNGKRLDFQQAIKNMRNINIFSHCYGQAVADEILSETANYMKKIGYTKNETEEILSQVYHVAYAPINEKPCAYSTNIELRSFGDYSLQRTNRKLYGNEIFEPYIKSLDVRQEDKTVRLFSNNFVSNKTHFDDHQIENLSKFFGQAEIPPRPRFILENLSAALMFGVVNSKQNHQAKTFDKLLTPEEFITTITPAIEKENAGENEKKQQRFWQEKRNKLRDITYQTQDLTLKSILNGNISVDDVVDVENYVPTHLPLKPASSVGTLTQARKGFGNKIIAKDDVFLNNLDDTSHYIVFKDGGVFKPNENFVKENKNWQKECAMNLKCNKIDLTDCVLLSVDEKTKKAKLENGYGFIKKEYESIDDLILGLKKSESTNLSKKQTRAVLNKMIASDVPLKNLSTKLNLEESVLKNEVEIKNNLITPKNKEMSF